MLNLVWSTLLGLASVPLLWLVRGLRRWQLGRRGVVELSLARDLRRGASLDAIASTAELLRAMTQDEALRAVILRVRHPGLGHAAAQEMQQSLITLRDAGKLVFVQLQQLGNQEILLASAADRVWAEPAADVFLSGVGAQLMFFGDALDRLGVDVQVEAAGAYKSFGETFARGHASRANREAVQGLVDDLNAQQIERIATGRRMAPQQLADLVARCPVGAEDALKAGLVDGIGHLDQAHSALEALLGRSVEPVSFGRYARLLAIEHWLGGLGRRDRAVAVVHLEGPVVLGVEASGGSGLRIDADRVVPALQALCRDQGTAAVILFIDSPGGSALASDIIARAVLRLGEEKPVVAVFANVAASGGYYIAAPAAEIVAMPGTITGSIGVVGGKLSLGRALGGLGIHTQSVTSGEGTLIFSPWRPFSDQEGQRFRALLSRTYDRGGSASLGRRHSSPRRGPGVDGAAGAGSRAGRPPG
ncbi:MAG: hypothetical protein GXP62_11395 [Oligoflexia bacterium]|nr:hypothetical protein [Oligoflexia bacterium]